MTPAGKMAVNFASMAQFFTTIFAFFGEQLFQAAGLNGTPLANSVLNNKVQLLGLSFLFNSIAQSVAKTNAFEVFVNGEQIFSKLEKNRMPTIEEILEPLAERGVGMAPPGNIARTNPQSRQM